MGHLYCRKYTKYTNKRSTKKYKREENKTDIKHKNNTEIKSTNNKNNTKQQTYSTSVSDMLPTVTLSQLKVVAFWCKQPRILAVIFRHLKSFQY